MIQVNRFTLDNGLRVIHHCDQTTAMVALNVLYNTGARDEDPAQTGVAHLFEHLMFGGSVNIPDFDQEISDAGGVDNAWTSEDFTNFYDVAPAHNAETLFHLESDRMLRPSLSERVVEIQKSVVIEEFKQQCLNRPYGDIYHHLRPLVYDTEHPYSWPVIGKTPDHIASVTRDDMVKRFEKFYTPSNAVLAISGNISFERAKELTEKWFGDIASRPANVRHLPEIHDLKEDVIKTVEGPVPQTMIMVAYLMDPYGTKEYTAADAITDILSAGDASRFHQHLLIGGDGTFADADASIMGSEDRGMLMLTGTLADNATDVNASRAKLIEHARSIINEPITVKDLERIKNRQKSLFVMGNLDFLSKAATIAMSEMHGEEPDAQLKRYLSLSVDDITETARHIFDSPSVTVIYKPNSKNQD